MFWAGAEVLPEFREGLVLELIGQGVEQRVAKEGQIGQQVGVAGARAIFPHPDVPAPMIADFDAAPVATDQGQPLLGFILLGQSAGQVITGLGGGRAGFFDGALAAQDQQGSGERKVRRQRFDGKGVQVADFDAPVPGLGLGKKRVSFKASIP